LYDGAKEIWVFCATCIFYFVMQRGAIPHSGQTSDCHF